MTNKASSCDEYRRISKNAKKNLDIYELFTIFCTQLEAKHINQYEV